MSQSEINDTEWQDAANWRVGTFYFSRRDSRAFVPKRHALLGATINFAKPIGVAFLLGILVFAALIIYLNTGD